jgi:hypothetical protein
MGATEYGIQKIRVTRPLLCHIRKISQLGAQLVNNLLGLCQKFP